MTDENVSISKVKRGMVFWYNINPDVDKQRVPDVIIGNRAYSDNLEYGDRPWLVVSDDSINRLGLTCTVVPMSSDNDYKTEVDNPYHISFKFSNRDRGSVILCEQIRTVNVDELRRYNCTLEPHIMEQVDKALASAMGLRISSSCDIDSLKGLEDIINNIVETKVAEERKARLSSDDLDEAVLRIGSRLESLFDNSHTNETEEVVAESVVAKKVEKKPRKSTTKKKSEGKRQYRRWSDDEILEFLEDIETKGLEETAKKWNYPNVESVRKRASYLNSKLK